MKRIKLIAYAIGMDVCVYDTITLHTRAPWINFLMQLPSDVGKICSMRVPLELNEINETWMNIEGKHLKWKQKREKREEERKNWREYTSAVACVVRVHVGENNRFQFALRNGWCICYGFMSLIRVRSESENFRFDNSMFMCVCVCTCLNSPSTDTKQILKWFISTINHITTHSHIGRQSGPGTHKNNSENNENDFILRHHNVRCTLTDHTQTHTFFCCVHKKNNNIPRHVVSLYSSPFSVYLWQCVWVRTCVCVCSTLNTWEMFLHKKTNYSSIRWRSSIGILENWFAWELKKNKKKIKNKQN